MEGHGTASDTVGLVSRERIIWSPTVAFGLSEANVALGMLKHDEIKGAAVLRVS